MLTKLFWSISLICCLPLVASAKNLGVIGQTYLIAETDFLQAIQNQVQQKVQSGEWAKWQVQQTTRLQAYVDRPTPVEGLTPALETRSRLYDPAIIVPYDIRDNHNQLIAASGSRLNPLDALTWSEALIFYDGDNPQQVAWAQQMDQQLQGKDKLILVNGSVSEQAQRFQKRVYFDQAEHLVKRLSIMHTPALVQQEGKQLKITEFKL